MDQSPCRFVTEPPDCLPAQTRRPSVEVSRPRYVQRSLPIIKNYNVIAIFRILGDFPISILSKNLFSLTHFQKVFSILNTIPKRRTSECFAW